MSIGDASPPSAGIMISMLRTIRPMYEWSFVTRRAGQVVVSQVIDVLGSGLVRDRFQHIAREDLGTEDRRHALPR